jgi:hypothetical protein
MRKSAQEGSTEARSKMILFPPRNVMSVSKQEMRPEVGSQKELLDAIKEETRQKKKWRIGKG